MLCVLRVVESGVIEVVTHGGRHEDQDVQLRELFLTNTQIPHFRRFQLLVVISVAGLDIL